MRVDGTVYFPTFASHVLYGNSKAKAAVCAALIEAGIEQAATTPRVESLLPKAAAMLSAPHEKGRLRLVCRPAPCDEAQRG